MPDKTSSSTNQYQRLFFEKFRQPLHPTHSDTLPANMSKDVASLTSITQLRHNDETFGGDHHNDHEHWKVHIRKLLFGDSTSDEFHTSFEDHMLNAASDQCTNSNSDLRLLTIPSSADIGALCMDVLGVTAEQTLCELPWSGEIQGFSWHAVHDHVVGVVDSRSATETKFVETELSMAQVMERLQRAKERHVQGAVDDWNIAQLKEDSLFVPNISLPLFTTVAPDVHTYLSSVVAQIDHACTQSNVDECDTSRHWDTQLASTEQAIGGFGTRSAQLYVKSGFTCTRLHDELGWSSAVNYMLRGSQGVALWIAFNLLELMPLLSNKAALLDSMETEDISVFVQKLWKWRSHLPSLSFAWQTPGTTVFSPSGRGSAHLVVTVGHLVEQVAWNRTFTEDGVRACLEFWEEYEPVTFNCGLATLHVIPCFAMQFHENLKFGCEVYLDKLKDMLGSSEEFLQAIQRVHSTTVQQSISHCCACNEQPTFLLSSDHRCETCVLFERACV